jgi:hypothetical protein
MREQCMEDALKPHVPILSKQHCSCTRDEASLFHHVIKYRVLGFQESISRPNYYSFDWVISLCQVESTTKRWRWLSLAELGF